MSTAYSEKLTAKDLFDMLEPKEQDKVMKAALTKLAPCVRNGHKFKSVAIQYRWFLPPQTKMVCSACAQTMYV